VIDVEGAVFLGAFDGYDKPEHERGHDPPGAAGGHEGEGDALGGAEPGDDDEVDERLHSEGGNHAEHDELERLGAFPHRDARPSPDDPGVGADDDDRADESEFFTDDGEEKVGGVFREVSEFLKPVTQSAAEDSAAGDGGDGLDELVSLTRGVRVWIEERDDAADAIGRGDDRADDPDECDGDEGGEVGPASAACEEDDRGGHEHQGAGAQVFFNHDGGDDPGTEAYGEEA
jgi:hypothetical protein